MALENKKQTSEILKLILDNQHPSSIAKLTHSSIQAINQKLIRMVSKGLITKKPGKPIFYDVTAEGRKLTYSQKQLNTFSQEQRLYKSTVNIHDFKVKIPIIKRGEPLDDKVVKLNNWIKQLTKIELPIPITLEVTTKNIILHFESVELARNGTLLPAFALFFNQGIEGARIYLHSKGYHIDVLSAKVISQHIATKTGDKIDEQIPDSSVVIKDLERKITTLTGTLDKPARAWIDKSQGTAEVETNDLLYEEKLIEMPETIQKMATDLKQARKETKEYQNNLALFNEQITKHLKAINDISHAANEQAINAREYSAAARETARAAKEQSKVVMEEARKQSKISQELLAYIKRKV